MVQTGVEKMDRALRVLEEDSRPNVINSISKIYDTLVSEDQAKVASELVDMIGEFAKGGTYLDKEGVERPVGTRTKMRAAELYHKLFLDRLKFSADYAGSGKKIVIEQRGISVKVDGTALSVERERALKESRGGKEG